MSVILIFLAVLALGAGWWLSRQGLMVKPWLQVDHAGTVPDPGPTCPPPAQLGLGIFLAVIGSLFALLISAYIIRAEAGDWRGFPLPWIVWANTLALLVTSLVLEWARSAAGRGALAVARTGVVAGSGAALLFVAGQLAAWAGLAGSGYDITSGPAGSFFYLMTAAHGLHVVGGIFALGRPLGHIRRADQTGLGHQERASRATLARTSVDLAATYWLFMLFVWVVLLLVLSGWAGAFLALCGQILSGSGLT